MKLSKSELERLESINAHSTPGPWWSGSANSCCWLRFSPVPLHPEVDGSGTDEYGMHVSGRNADADAALIVAAKEALPGLIEAAKELEGCAASAWVRRRADGTWEKEPPRDRRIDCLALVIPRFTNMKKPTVIAAKYDVDVWLVLGGLMWSDSDVIAYAVISPPTL